MCVHEFGEDWQYNATESILAEDMFFDCDEDFDDDVFIHELFSDISLAAFTDGHHGGHQHETRGISGTLHKLHSLFDGPPHPNHPHPGPPGSPPPPGPPGPHPHPGPPPPPPSGPPHFPHQEPVYALNVSVPTLLANHSLNVHIIQFEHRSPLPPHRSFFPTRVIVQGHPVLPDIVARNGAVHVVDRVLNPIKHHHHHKHHHDHDRGPDDGVAAKDEWEDWEEWLPKWAEEN